MKQETFEVYKRFCKRCGTLYTAEGRHSRVCPNCCKPRGRSKEK